MSQYSIELTLLTLIKVGVLDCPELLETPLYLTWGKTVPIILIHFFKHYLESKAAGENFVFYIQENMTGKINWVPHLKAIQFAEGAIDLDFGNLRALIPAISNTLGYYKGTSFQFSKKKLLLLANELKNAGQSRKKLEDSPHDVERQDNIVK